MLKKVLIRKSGQRFIAGTAGVLIATFLLSWHVVFAKSNEIPLNGHLAFTAEQSQAALDIVDKLSTDHFRKLELDDAVSAETLDNYLDYLDPGRSYFTQKEIDAYHKKWSTLLDDYLKQGDLTPAFDMYNDYMDRAEARFKKNIALLESDYQFNFDTDLSLRLDYKDQPWPGSEKALDDLWIEKLTDGLLRLKLSDKDSDAARELLVKRFKGLLTRLEQRKPDDVFELYMNSLAALYDPHTNYMSPKSLEDFNISLSLSLEGIGAVLQTSDEHTEVVRIIPGGPADKQGILKAEDKILSVGQDDEDLVDVVGWRLDEVVDLIRGAKGTTVRLEILSPTSSTPKIISIVRDKIKLEEQSAKSEIITVPGINDQEMKFGVISVPAFYLDIEAIYNRDKNYKSTTRDVAKLIENLEAQNVEGIILDLRNNGGGFLTEATGLVDLFIDQGPVVQIKDAYNRISRNQLARRPAVYKGPLLVLINRLSASASEITAGAIQDYGRGLIVGDTTFGKGTVQARQPLTAGELKITESKFYRVSGGSTQHKGVVPDIKLPTFFDHDELGESSYEHALPWDTIHPVPHRNYASFAPVLPVLVSNHNKRMHENPDLIHLKEVTDLALEQRKSFQSISLNLEKRRLENDQNEEKLLDLENERRVSKGLKPYESREEWKKDVEYPEKLPLAVKDPILFEAGNILGDLIKTDSSLATIH